MYLDYNTLKRIRKFYLFSNFIYNRYFKIYEMKFFISILLIILLWKSILTFFKIEISKCEKFHT